MRINETTERKVLKYKPLNLKYNLKRKLLNNTQIFIKGRLFPERARQFWALNSTVLKEGFRMKFSY